MKFPRINFINKMVVTLFVGWMVFLTAVLASNQLTAFEMKCRLCDKNFSIFANIDFDSLNDDQCPFIISYWKFVYFKWSSWLPLLISRPSSYIFIPFFLTCKIAGKVGKHICKIFCGLHTLCKVQLLYISSLRGCVQMYYYLLVTQ